MAPDGRADEESLPVPPNPAMHTESPIAQGETEMIERRVGSRDQVTPMMPDPARSAAQAGLQALLAAVPFHLQGSSGMASNIASRIDSHDERAPTDAGRPGHDVSPTLGGHPLESVFWRAYDRARGDATPEVAS